MCIRRFAYRFVAERRAGDMNGLNAALDTSYANAPHQLDAEP
jgi:hypothetical protein